MGDKTRIVDREGRRVRFYTRKDASRPGMQERRRMRELGMKWCRECHNWLPASQVTKNGLCRPHENEITRAWYQAKGAPAIRQRVRARKRGMAALPKMAQEYLLEQTEEQCVYCGEPADTWDHVAPVKAGGQTEPGNIVPACMSCNSSKNANEVSEWMNKKGITASADFMDIITLGIM